MGFSDTPAWKTTAPHLDEITEAINGGDLTFDEQRKIAGLSIDALKGFVQPRMREPVALVSRFMADAAISKLEALAIRHPESEEEILAAAFLVAGAWAQFAIHARFSEATKQAASMSYLIELNAEKGAARERAKAIASEAWQDDTAQTIRLGDMAERVYRALVEQGFTKTLPGTVERIKEWIKPVAPDYARKGGRRRKPS